MTQGPDVWVRLSAEDVQWLARNPGGSLGVMTDGKQVRITHDKPEMQTIESTLLGDAQ